MPAEAACVCVCVGRGRVWTDGSQGHGGQAAAVAGVMMSAAAGSLFARLGLFVNNDPLTRCRPGCCSIVG